MIYCNKISHSLRICSVFLLVFTSSSTIGCGNTDQTAMPDDASSHVESESNSNVVATNDSEVAAEPAELKQQVGIDIPVPIDIPVYANAKTLDRRSKPSRLVLHWETDDPKSAVMDFYREQLPALGWNVLKEETYGAFEATKGSQKLDVWIGAEPNKPVSILIRKEDQ